MEDFKAVPIPDISVLKIPGRINSLLEKGEKPSFMMGELGSSQMLVSVKSNHSGDLEAKVCDKKDVSSASVKIVQNPTVE